MSDKLLTVARKASDNSKAVDSVRGHEYKNHGRRYVNTLFLRRSARSG